MSTGSQRADRGSPATLEPVAPSLVVKIAMRQFMRLHIVSAEP
jgi:hypothetical protein